MAGKRQTEQIDTLDDEALAQMAAEAAEANQIDVADVHEEEPANPAETDPPEGDEPEGGQPGEDGPEPQETEEPEVTEPEPEKGKEKAPKAKPGGDAPPAGLLEKLRKLGWEHNFQTEEEAAEGLVQLRRFASRKLEHEDLGSLAVRAGMTPAQLEALAAKATKKSDPFAWAPPVEYDPTWENEITVNKETGALEGPADKIEKLKAFEAYKAGYWQRIGRDPFAIVRNSREIIEEIVQDVLAGVRAHERSQDFLKVNGAFIRAHRAEFEQLLERGTPPDLALEHLRLKHPGKPAGAKGAEAKEKDLKGLKEKSAEVPTPKKAAPRKTDYSKLTEEQLARMAWEEAGRPSVAS